MEGDTALLGASPDRYNYGYRITALGSGRKTARGSLMEPAARNPHSHQEG